MALVKTIATLFLLTLYIRSEHRYRRLSAAVAGHFEKAVLG